MPQVEEEATQQPEGIEDESFSDGWDDISQLLADFDGAEAPKIHLYRKDAKGKNHFVASLEPSDGPEDIQERYGGGSFLLMVRSRTSEKILKSKRFSIEGPAKQSAAEITPQMQTSPGGGLDAGTMLASAMTMVTSMMGQQMEAARRSAEQQQAMLLKLMENMGQATKPADPFDDFEKMLRLADRMSSRGDDGSAWVAMLPALEPLIDKLGAAMRRPEGMRPAHVVPGPPRRPTTPVANGAGSTTPVGEAPDAPDSSPDAYTPDARRLALAIQTLLAVAGDESAEPGPTAATIASILGDDAAAQLADEAGAVDMICAQYPQLEPRRDFLAAMHAELVSLYATDDEPADEPPEGPDDPSAQPETAQNAEAA